MREAISVRIQEYHLCPASGRIYFQYGFSPNWTSAFTEFPATYKANRWSIGLGVGKICMRLVTHDHI